MSGSATYTPDKELEYQIQIGSKLYPEYPVKSLQEAFYQLRKTLGIHATNFHSCDILDDTYRNYNFIIGVDTEKVLAAGFTGLNTKAGDLMTVKCTSMSTVAAELPSTIYIVLHSDMVMNIRDTGVEVFE